MKHFVIRLWQKLDRDDCFNRAASLSYITIFAFIPVSSILFFLFARFQFFGEIQDKLRDLFFAYFVPQSAAQMNAYFARFIEKMGNLGILGIIALIITSLLLVDALEKVMNDIWGVIKKRPLLNKLASYWAFLSLAPVLIGLSFYLTTRVSSYPLVKFFGESSFFKYFSAIVIPFFITVVAFFVVYYFLPNAEVDPVKALIGAITGAFLWEVSKWGFDIYLAKFSFLQTFYGTVATIPIFIFWIYLSWLFLLVGAQIAVLLEGDPGERFSPALTLLTLLEVYKKFESEGECTLKDIQEKLKVNKGRARAMLRRLEFLRLSAEVEKGKFVPVKAAKRLLLVDVLHKLEVININDVKDDLIGFKTMEEIKKRLNKGIDAITLEEVLSWEEN